MTTSSRPSKSSSDDLFYLIPIQDSYCSKWRVIAFTAAAIGLAAISLGIVGLVIGQFTYAINISLIVFGSISSLSPLAFKVYCYFCIKNQSTSPSGALQSNLLTQNSCRSSSSQNNSRVDQPWKLPDLQYSFDLKVTCNNFETTFKIEGENDVNQPGSCWLKKKAAKTFTFYYLDRDCQEKNFEFILDENIGKLPDLFFTEIVNVADQYFLQFQHFLNYCFLNIKDFANLDFIRLEKVNGEIVYIANPYKEKWENFKVEDFKTITPDNIREFFPIFSYNLRKEVEIGFHGSVIARYGLPCHLRINHYTSPYLDERETPENFNGPNQFLCENKTYQNLKELLDELLKDSYFDNIPQITLNLVNGKEVHYPNPHYKKN